MYLPFVNISANWSLVRACSINMEWSKFTLSNNQSKPTLCVLVTCLKFGPRPLLLIGSRTHCLRQCTVGLTVNCSEFRVECGRLIHIHNCQNVNETEWLFRVCDAQRFPCMALWITFPTHTPKIEELANHPCVNLRPAKEFKTLHRCEKLRFACSTSTMREQTCVIQIRTVNLLTLIFESGKSIANEASRNRPSLPSSIWLPTWQNCL